MRLLDQLRDELPRIESENDWEHQFVEGLIIELEEGRDFSKSGRPLTGRQFKKLCEIHTRYCEK